MGAVMGSKGVKAIVLDGAAAVKTAYGNEELFKEARKEWVDILRGHPVTSQGLPGFGTAVLVNVINEAGALPTKNFRMGKFDGAEKISGETLAANIEKRGGKTKHGCHTGCVIQCSQVYHGKDGKKTLTPAFPKVAGQNAAYAEQQMKDIKSGARNNGQTAAMKGVMHLVNDQEIKVLAEYLSKLK